jgi:hypothetical protein
MSCKYMLIGSATLCARPCEGDYCTEHQKSMDAVDEMYRGIQEFIREKRNEESTL